MTSCVDAVVGERIAQARRRRGWYQKDLAARIGMSESWVSQVERGVLTVDSLQTAEKIAAELLLDVTYVLALDVRYPTQPPQPPDPRPLTPVAAGLAVTARIG